MSTEPSARFTQDPKQVEALAAERDELAARLQDEQAAFDEAEAELIRLAGRMKAMEQELNIAWHRVRTLEEQLEYERLPLHRRTFHRRPTLD